MKTPLLRMIAAGCFGPSICRTRAIWFFKDVKRTATARAQSKFGLRPCCQPAAWRWPQSTAGRDIVIDHQNRSDGSRRRHLRSRKWTPARQSQLRPA
jgi:hypothetical protein